MSSTKPKQPKAKTASQQQAHYIQQILGPGKKPAHGADLQKKINAVKNFLGEDDRFTDEDIAKFLQECNGNTDKVANYIIDGTYKPTGSWNVVAGKKAKSNEAKQTKKQQAEQAQSAQEQSSAQPEAAAGQGVSTPQPKAQQEKQRTRSEHNRGSEQSAKQTGGPGAKTRGYRDSDAQNQQGSRQARQKKNGPFPGSNNAPGQPSKNQTAPTQGARPPATNVLSVANGSTGAKPNSTPHVFSSSDVTGAVSYAAKVAEDANKNVHHQDSAAEKQTTTAPTTSVAQLQQQQLQPTAAAPNASGAGTTPIVPAEATLTAQSAVPPAAGSQTQQTQSQRRKKASRKAKRADEKESKQSAAPVVTHTQTTSHTEAETLTTGSGASAATHSSVTQRMHTVVEDYKGDSFAQDFSLTAVRESSSHPVTLPGEYKNLPEISLQFGSLNESASVVTVEQSITKQVTSESGISSLNQQSVAITSVTASTQAPIQAPATSAAQSQTSTLNNASVTTASVSASATATTIPSSAQQESQYSDSRPEPQQLPASMHHVPSMETDPISQVAFYPMLSPYQMAYPYDSEGADLRQPPMTFFDPTFASGGYHRANSPDPKFGRSSVVSTSTNQSQPLPYRDAAKYAGDATTTGGVGSGHQTQGATQPALAYNAPLIGGSQFSGIYPGYQYLPGQYTTFSPPSHQFFPRVPSTYYKTTQGYSFGAPYASAPPAASAQRNAAYPGDEDYKPQQPMSYVPSYNVFMPEPQHPYGTSKPAGGGQSGAGAPPPTASKGQPQGYSTDLSGAVGQKNQGDLYKPSYMRQDLPYSYQSQFANTPSGQVPVMVPYPPR